MIFRLSTNESRPRHRPECLSREKDKSLLSSCLLLFLSLLSANTNTFPAPPPSTTKMSYSLPFSPYSPRSVEDLLNVPPPSIPSLDADLRMSKGSLSEHFDELLRLVASVFPCISRRVADFSTQSRRGAKKT